MPSMIELRYNGTELDGDFDIKRGEQIDTIKVVNGKFMMMEDWEAWKSMGIMHATRFFTSLDSLLTLEMEFTEKQARKIGKWWKERLEQPEQVTIE